MRKVMKVDKNKRKKNKSKRNWNKKKENRTKLNIYKSESQYNVPIAGLHPQSPRNFAKHPSTRFSQT
jgi:hypothetical protein